VAPDSIPTSADQQRNEAGAPAAEQAFETRRLLTDHNGSIQPEEVRLAVSQAIDQATTSVEAVANYAKRQPLKALAAAALIGAVIGRIM